MTNNQSNGFYTHCASYNGMDQTNPIDGTTQHIVTRVSTDIATITTASSSDWVAAFWSSGNGRGHFVGSGTIQRTNDSQEAIEDSGGQKSSRSNSVIMNITLGYDDTAVTAFGLKKG